MIEEKTEEQPITMEEFLLEAPLHVYRAVSGVFVNDRRGDSRISLPDLTLYCEYCEGERRFICNGPARVPDHGNLAQTGDFFLRYQCKNCEIGVKVYIFRTEYLSGKTWKLMKYGEFPSKINISPELNKFLNDEEKQLFRKGLQSEANKAGIGAFTYYRRVVENARNRIVDEIVKACERTGESPELIEKIKEQKGQFQFSRSVENIKDLLPKSFFIDGHNPLTALHRVLSEHIHDRKDDECLQLAGTVRLVITALVERMEHLKNKHSEISKAIGKLINKDSGRK